MKYWEIIADNLKKAEWSLGWVSALDSEGRTIWIVDAHRGDGKRYVGRADEKLAVFLELDRRFALAATCLDNDAPFLPNSASLNRSLNRREDTSPPSSPPLPDPRIAGNQLSGGKKGRIMNPLTQSKNTTILSSHCTDARLFCAFADSASGGYSTGRRLSKSERP